MDKPSKILFPLMDDHFVKLKDRWFAEAHENVGHEKFINTANEWFTGSKINDIRGFENFKDIDVIIGCTQFIESFCLKNAWNVQVLPFDYSFYAVMGKQSTEPGNLKPGVPLIISLPNWKFGDIYPGWQDILKECEEKKIDIHIDGAWLTCARDIELDLNHPNIQSIGMSMSKYNLTWNRIGLRWSRQRSMDTITMFNVQRKYNESLTACGYFMMENIDRDYGWNTYRQKHFDLADKFDMLPTKLLHVVQTKDKKGVMGIGNLLAC